MCALRSASVDEYIAGFPDDVQRQLHQFRNTVMKAAPHASEGLMHNIPTYKQNGLLVHFGGYRRHIGFYPLASALKEFAFELTPYEQAKGAIHFPYDDRLPLDLIERMVRFRVEENLGKKKH